MSATTLPDVVQPVPHRRHAWIVAGFSIPVLFVVWDLSPAVSYLTFPELFVLVLLAVCSATDLAWRKIYNFCTYPALLAALVFSLLYGMTATSYREPASRLLPAGFGPIDFGSSLLGGLLCFAIMLGIYRISGGGAGDVKLATALGAWLGPQRSLEMLLCTYIAAGTVAACWMIWVIGPGTLLSRFLHVLGHELLPGRVAPPEPLSVPPGKRELPMGVFFFVGVLLTCMGVLQ